MLTRELQEALKSEFVYNLQTGDLKKKDGKFYHLDIVVLNNKRLNRKLVSWFLATGSVPAPDCVIIQCDLNESNYRFSNLKIVTREDSRKITRLVKNARKYIRLREAKNDAYDVVVEWNDFDTGKKVKETFGDHTVARRFMRSLLRELLRELQALGIDIAEAELFLSKPRL